MAVDAVVGNQLFEVKTGVTALRSVRVGLIQLAYALAGRPDARGFLVLPDVAVTHERLRREWSLAASVLRSDFANRLNLCVRDQGGHYIGIPREIDSRTQKILAKLTPAQEPREDKRRGRVDASFVVAKVLLHHRLTDGGFLTMQSLVQKCGFSYPTVASAARELGSLIERGPGRSVRLQFFPNLELGRLVNRADRARGSVRYADRSGQPRTIEAHVRRLEKLKPKEVAIGGVLAAKHYVADLNITGAPRLDLSVHAPTGHADLTFVEKLDPALKRIQDPHAPAQVVVHSVRHADSLFIPRPAGLSWVDPVECLLDLHEANLHEQAAQFYDELEAGRSSTS